MMLMTLLGAGSARLLPFDFAIAGSLICLFSVTMMSRSLLWTGSEAFLGLQACVCLNRAGFAGGSNS